MSLNQYLKAVVGVFETRYPQFWWDDFFLDEEKPQIAKFIELEHKEGCPPSDAYKAFKKQIGAKSATVSKKKSTKTSKAA